jgi:hypothetical protein
MKTLFKLILILSISLPFISNAQDKTFLKKYAGTYNLLADGQAATPTSDKYVLTPDGKGTWTMFTTVNPDGTTSNKPTKIAGSWTASEGVINLNFNMGADKGGELLSEFKLLNGVFRSEGVVLKKAGAVAKAKK